MNLNLYQSYYDNSQLNLLSPVFIPFDNTENKNPELREHVLWKKVHAKHIYDDSYWGLLSWRWQQKTKLDEQEFKDWILSNPGYDVYFIDPCLDVAVDYKNLWVHGERWHPGMKDYCNKLFPRIGVNESVDEIDYKGKHFATSSFFIGNSRFWLQYMYLVDTVIEISKSDPELKDYMFDRLYTYNGANIPHFCFIIERLFSLFLYKNTEVKVLKFPSEHECYKRIFGDGHQSLLERYNQK
jgi:hypothetical protein